MTTSLHRSLSTNLSLEACTRRTIHFSIARFTPRTHVDSERETANPIGNEKDRSLFLLSFLIVDLNAFLFSHFLPFSQHPVGVIAGSFRIGYEIGERSDGEFFSPAKSERC